jgi:methanesulfonate monooxygenase subunit beta
LPLSNDVQKIHDLIADSCALLDEQKFDQWIALTSPDFHYRLSAFSDELGKTMVWMETMVWMDFGRDALENLMQHASDHERNLVHYSRHVSAIRVGSAQNGIVPVRSSLTVYYTDLEGTTAIYAVGVYQDKATFVDGAPMLTERDVLLTTRRLPFGSHYPL